MPPLIWPRHSSNATNQQEKARWEYLVAQLYEMSGKYKESEKYYAKVISHTTDPIMDIYARLFTIRVNKDGGEKAIEKNVAELVKMAKRDKYARTIVILFTIWLRRCNWKEIIWMGQWPCC